MKIVVTIVAAIGVDIVNGLQTTWWTDEIDVPKGKPLSEVIQEHIRSRIDKFPLVSDHRPRPSPLSVCYTILPRKSKK